MKKSDYEWYKSKEVCPRCRVNDAFHNHTFCAKCLEKISVENTRYSHKRAGYQANQNKAKKIQYHERKKAGLCTVCGKKTAQHGQLCNECHAKRMNRRRHSKEYQKFGGRKCGDAFRERMAAGVCMFCGKPQVAGYKFCKDCLAKRQQISRKTGIQNSKNGYMRKEVNRQWEQNKLKHLGNT